MSGTLPAFHKLAVHFIMSSSLLHFGHAPHADTCGRRKKSYLLNCSHVFPSPALYGSHRRALPCMLTRNDGCHLTRPSDVGQADPLQS